MSITFRCPVCGFRGPVENTHAYLPVLCVCGQRYDRAVDAQLPPLYTRWGDVIAGMTKAVGIKPCGGCNRRRRKLNRLSEKIFGGK